MWEEEEVGLLCGTPLLIGSWEPPPTHLTIPAVYNTAKTSVINAGYRKFRANKRTLIYLYKSNSTKHASSVYI
jgi:hypothetical protein